MKNRFRNCSVDGCIKNAHRDAHGKSGLCVMHYQRHRKHGDTSVCGRTPSPAMDWLRAHASFVGDECLQWPFHIGSDGYGRAHNPTTGALSTASRLMCIAAHGAPPTPKHEAAHSCGNGKEACVNPRHLYWATPSENQADRVAHRTSNRGERQWKSKLTEDDVREIRRRLGTETQQSIAVCFNIDPSVISDIKRGKKWGWLL